MPRVITDICVACGACADQCPVACITVEDVAVIDADTCIDCGVCEPRCPYNLPIREMLKGVVSKFEK